MSKKLTTYEFQNRLNKIYGENEYVVLSEYINNSTKVDILHKKCGNIIQKAPVKMTGSTKEGCYICSGKNHYKTKETLQSEIDIKFPNEYKIIGEYVNAKTPIEVYKLSCNHVYYISPDNLLRGKGCPKCWIGHSHYMQMVEDYLDKNNIKYVPEKRFDDCKNIRALPFDYYLPDFNMCIEVDGEFHYNNNNVYKNRPEQYIKLKNRDAIKTRYCKDNNIELLRLPYFEESNFETILNEKLYANTKITSAI